MMCKTIDVKRNPSGYYTLYLNGQFAGNFDTISEALQEAEETETAA